MFDLLRSYFLLNTNKMENAIHSRCQTSKTKLRGVLLFLFFSNDDGKIALLVCSQDLNVPWSSHSRILNRSLQYKHGNHNHRNIFHLNKHHAFAVTDPWATMEDKKIEWILQDKMAILIHPPFLLELYVLDALGSFQFDHGIRMISHLIAFSHGNLFE